MYLKCVVFFMLNICLSLASDLLITPDGKEITINEARPSIRNKDIKIGYYLQNTKRQFECEAYGYPLPLIEWDYSDSFNESIGNFTRTIQTSAISNTEIKSTIQLTIGPSGNLSCKACNDLGCYTSITQTIFTLDVPYGFGIKKPTYNVVVGDVFKLTCYASIYRHTNNIKWFNGSKRITNSGRIDIKPTIVRQHSYVSELSIYNINIQDANYYTCRGETIDGILKLDICELIAHVEDLSHSWIGTFYELILLLFCVFIILQFSVIAIYFLLKLWSNDF